MCSVLYTFLTCKTYLLAVELYVVNGSCPYHLYRKTLNSMLHRLLKGTDCTDSAIHVNYRFVMHCNRNLESICIEIAGISTHLRGQPGCVNYIPLSE